MAEEGNQLRGRGRGYARRGHRGRGRGRGRGKQTYTLDMHQETFDMPPPIIPPQPTSERPIILPEVKKEAPKKKDDNKSEINKKLNVSFSTTMNPRDYFQEFDLNVFGYQELIHATYQAIRAIAKHVDEKFSEAEFHLCCGWLLYHRVFKIWSEHRPSNVRLDHFDDAIPSEMDVPAPIADYLNLLGVHVTELNCKLIPRIYLPNFNSNARVGTVPVQDFDDAKRYIEGTTAFFPFTLYCRLVIDPASAQLANNHPNFPAIEEIGQNRGNDNDLRRHGTYSMLAKVVPRNNNKNPLTAEVMNGFMNENSILGRVRFNANLFKKFIGFVASIQKDYLVKKLQKSTVGVRSIYAFSTAADGTPEMPPESYVHYSNVALTSNEQEIAVIFKYRLAVLRDDNTVLVNHADRLITVNNSPAIMHTPGTSQIEAPRSLTTVMYEYVHSFQHNK
jgi:hypothetical protein